MSREIGLWLYKNGGGEAIQKKMIQKLNDREIAVIPDINLREAIVNDGNILYQGRKVDQLDLFFSYNAGGQTPYQVFLYEALNRVIPMINSYNAFKLTEDKFQTSFLLEHHGIATPDFELCHAQDAEILHSLIEKWGKMVYKPTDGWGGVGLTKIENKAMLDALYPFLNQLNLRFLYVEKFIHYDNTDFRVDIVDGEFVSCYGRKAPGDDWRTNITGGGSIFLREPTDEVIELAKKTANICDIDVAGIDIIYDMEKEQYVVLEVNGIPAFATPEQEKMGLDFNNKKIDLIVDLIDRKSKI